MITIPQRHEDAVRERGRIQKVKLCDSCRKHENRDVEGAEGWGSGRGVPLQGCPPPRRGEGLGKGHSGQGCVPSPEISWKFALKMVHFDTF